MPISQRKWLLEGRERITWRLCVTRSVVSRSTWSAYRGRKLRRKEDNHPPGTIVRAGLNRCADTEALPGPERFCEVKPERPVPGRLPYSGQPLFVRNWALCWNWRPNCAPCSSKEFHEWENSMPRYYGPG